MAAVLGVSASTLRHWEKKLELPVPRDELGQRTYPPEWQDYFRQVKALLDAGKKYDEIKGELSPPVPVEPEPPAEPPVPVVPPAELEEIKAAIARLAAGLLQTGEEVGAGKIALAEAAGRIDATRADLNQVTDDMVAQSRKLAKVEQGLEGMGGDVDAVKAGVKDVTDEIEVQSRKLAQVESGCEAVGGDVASARTEIEAIRAEVKSAADAAVATGLKVAELAEQLAQMQDGSGGQNAVAGLQSAIKDIEAELKGCNKTLKQALKAVEGLQEVQVGTTDEIAGLQEQIAALQASPGLSKEDLEALQTFRKRFWWYMVAMVFLYMVLTIGVIESYR